MDVQIEILDYLGSEYTIKMLRSDFLGKSEAGCLAKLNKWFPSDDNRKLASLIHQYMTVYASAASLGRNGGSSTSEAKQAASRANGRKGGRPRKQQ